MTLKLGEQRYIIFMYMYSVHGMCSLDCSIVCSTCHNLHAHVHVLSRELTVPYALKCGMKSQGQNTWI